MAAKAKKPGEGSNEEGEGTEEHSESETLTRDEVSKLVNKAVTTHLTRFESKLTGKLDDLVKKLTPPKPDPDEDDEGGADDHGQEPTAILPAAARKPEVPPAPASAVAPGTDPKLQAELKNVRKRLDASEKREKELNEAREAAEKKRLVAEERSALGEALRSANVDGARLKGAMALLYDSEQRIVRDDQGGICFKVVTDGAEEVMSLKDGVAEWCGTEEGKMYLPPKGAGGSGSGPARNLSPKGTSKDDLRNEAMQVLFDAVTNADSA